MFKISPDETLKIVQELYEKKLVTYPRTDARVLSTAVAKEIQKNLSGLKSVGELGTYAGEILEKELTRVWQKPDMSMTSRLQTTMPSFPPARAWGPCAV